MANYQYHILVKANRRTLKISPACPQYMIIHNLLKLLKGESYSINVFDHNAYPIVTSCNLLNQAYDLTCEKTIKSFNTITSDARLSYFPSTVESCANLYGAPPTFVGPCYANVKYLAQENIMLKPGFSVSYGCNFLAKVEPISGCVKREGSYDLFNLPYNPTNSENKSSQNLTFQSPNNYNKATETELFVTPNTEIYAASPGITTIFPNPSNGQVNIVNNSNTLLKLRVYNIYNEEILTTILNKGKETIDMTNFSKGSYLFILFDEEKIYTMEKVIIQ